MFVEYGHKRTFLENFIKIYNAKKKSNDSRNITNSMKISWVHNVGAKTRKEFKKVNKDIAFTSVKNLQSILCQYIGESKKKALTSCIEHQQDSRKGNWETVGAISK